MTTLKQYFVMHNVLPAFICNLFIPVRTSEIDLLQACKCIQSEITVPTEGMVFTWLWEVSQPARLIFDQAMPPGIEVPRYRLAEGILDLPF